MKNRLLFLPLFITFLIAFVGCKQETSTEQATTTKVEPPEQIISLERAQMLYSDYTKRRSGIIEAFEDSINISMKDTSRFNPARYIYYDYKTIKQYMAYIEQEAASAGVEISTLRFYLGNYGDTDVHENGASVKYPRQNTIFVLPTLNKGGREFGFSTRETDQAGTKQLFLLDEQLQSVPSTDMGNYSVESTKSYAGWAPDAMTGTKPMQSGNGGLILNEGSSSPPPKK